MGERDGARRAPAPQVAIVTPTRNRAAFLAGTLASTRAQEFGDFEHVIVDDGSSDDTAAVVEPFLEDRRYRFLRQAAGGQARARNAGIAATSAPYVAFLDSDDLWCPDKLAVQVAHLDAHPEVDVCYGDYRFIDRDGEPLPRTNMRRHSGRIVEWMLGDNCVSMNTTLVRRTALERHGGFREIPRADDYDLWLRLSAYCRFGYLPRVLAAYRVMDGQLSSDVEARLEANVEIVAHFLRHHGDRLTTGERRRGLARHHARRARYLARAGRRSRAIALALRACTLAPGWSGAWRAVARTTLGAS